jgi:hypothetical protein
MSLVAAHLGAAADLHQQRVTETTGLRNVMLTTVMRSIN